MRSPVARYGAQLGSTMRRSRVSGPMPKARAVSLATGSTSVMPYIAWNTSGNVAPNTASVTLSDGLVPYTSTRMGMSATDGMGRRTSMVSPVSSRPSRLAPP
jgi:hypothetical protein